ncbi:STAS domain-containing protein [Sphaerisporangium sp. TRM90804]|uniref:STAS domain-containing protein n=1 Tax=Sphaerisporangium sp. TRM90804 TaxID=3031113 RepID=UPI00244B5BE9|nr:STAS domain-containing protein [Sphaerisporangium sp. TRM90804]MDH2429471.1 STAS domain-containing protein [Sphaerisporangium sp. TRM90804]
MRVVERRPRSATVAVAGELDASGSHLVEGVLQHLVGQGCANLLLDAGELRFCDVTGARTLVTVHARLRLEGGGLVVLAQPMVCRLFGMLWPVDSPAHPRVLKAGPSETTTTLIRLPAKRHFPVFRGVERPRPPARQAAGRRATSRPEPPEDALERSRRLRRQAEARLQIMREKAEIVLSTMAEVHDRLAGLHGRLPASGGSGAACGLPCDGETHHRKAEECRRRAADYSVSQ